MLAPHSSFSRRALLLSLLAVGSSWTGYGADLYAQTGAGGTFADVVSEHQPKMVKIYGAGGLRGFEAYQSGFLISSEGHVLTIWSYVLDTDDVVIMLNDGRKLKAELVGADPRTEIAVLKVDVADPLPHYDLKEAVTLEAGDRVLAFSNLYGVATGDEAVSVQHGVVSVRSTLSARRGAFESNYDGPIYVLDAMTNNPGAAGGALTDLTGRLAGLVGRELVNAQNNTWLNYAAPIDALQESVDDILSGNIRPRSDDPELKKPATPHTLVAWGLVLVPEVLPKTPPFVERVVIGSSAESAGLRPDDLIVFVDGRIIGSIDALREELSYIDRIDPVRLTVQRDQELVEIEIKP